MCSDFKAANVQTQMQTFGIQAQQLSWLMSDALRDLQSKQATG